MAEDLPNRNYIGVQKSGSKWVANIHKNGITIYLGTYDEAQKAAAAYDFARLHLHGKKHSHMLNFSVELAESQVEPSTKGPADVKAAAFTAAEGMYKLLKLKRLGLGPPGEAATEKSGEAAAVGVRIPRSPEA